MRLFVFNVLVFGALMLGWVSCQEYESGTYPLEESTVRYEGTLYDYLADKAAHPDVTYDSLLFLAGRLPGLKDSLQKRKEVTLFAVTDQSFRLAFDGLNRYREAYGKGKHLGLEDLLIEPFTVVCTKCPLKITILFILRGIMIIATNWIPCCTVTCLMDGIPWRMC